MSVTLDKVKYPRLYCQMVLAMKEYQKQAKERLDKEVYVYSCKDHNQASLEKLIPRKETP